MRDGKLDLLDTVSAVKPMGDNDAGKVLLGLNEESKGQAISESSIPLSPQWLHNKPNDSKMDIRGPVFAGHSNDSHLKDGWRSDLSDEKKDWRRIASENETSRRWREEERETGLLSVSRDRKKPDRRPDNLSSRDEAKNSPIDRWHEGTGRNPVHEVRRDSKWSSRWGPDDKEKDSRTEKKIEMEKEKDEIINDTQCSIGSNRTAPERDGESRDKWRPRHRLEVHSGSPLTNRVAPGFGIEKGRVEGANAGFMLGRGRSNPIGRSSFVGSTNAGQLCKAENFIGKPMLATDSFRYPRGKLLDLYRRQKRDLTYDTLPDGMDISSPVTQLDFGEPLAFIAPESEEEAIILDIWKGKVTSSGVMFRKGKNSDDVSGVDDCESIGSKQGSELSGLVNESNMFGEPFNGYGKVVDKDGSLLKAQGNDFSLIEKETCSALYPCTDPALEKCARGNEGHLHSDDVVNVSMELKSKLPDDSRFLYASSMAEQNHNLSSTSGIDTQNTDDKINGPIEDTYFYYIDPTGNTQGPFLGADIMLWFEEGYFGLDLPVRIADAPEETPFQNLGDVLPKLKNEYSQLELGEPVGLEERTGSSLPASSISDMVATSSMNGGLPQSFLKFSGQPAVQPPRHPESDSSRIQYTDGLKLPDNVTEDEEIIFPGRPGSSGLPSVMLTSGPGSEAIGKMDNFLPFSNKLPDSSMPQSDSKLHPFGLLWSELEGSHSRQPEMSDLSMNLGRQPFISTDVAAVSDKWADISRQEAFLPVNSFHDSVAARAISPVEPPPNRFDLAEKLMSQQHLSRNLIPTQSRLGDSLLEQHLTGHQQLPNNTASDLEHLLALHHHQQQRQIQIQQQQLHRQQQLQQQQKLVEERLQAQARQALLEQLLHNQMPDSFLLQSHADPLRGNNVLDQVLLEQHLLQEIQQRSHTGRQFLSSVDQIAQAKYGHSARQEQQRDMFELLSRSQRGQMHSLEQQLLHQEQVQARQLSMGLRPRMSMDEDRMIGSGWSGNSNDQFLRNLPGSNLRIPAAGIGQGDFYQRLQRPTFDEQLNQFDRTHSFQDRLYQGLHDPSVPFERSMSLPGGAPGLPMDAINAMAQSQGLDMQDLSTLVQSRSQVGAYSLHSNPHNHVATSQFTVPHMDTIENRWSESNLQQSNDWMEARLQQLQVNYDRQKDSDSKLNTENDIGLWMSDGTNDDRARQLLMDLLHQKSNHQPSSSVDLKDGMLFDRRGTTPSVYGGNPELEGSMNNSFNIGSYNSGIGGPANVGLAVDQNIYMDTHDKFPGRPESGTMSAFHTLLTSHSDPAQIAIMDSTSDKGGSITEEFRDIEARKHMFSSKKYFMTEPQDVTDDQGYFEEKSVPHGVTLSENASMNQISALLKEQDSAFARRPPVSIPQEDLPEMVSDTVSRSKSLLISSDGGFQANQVGDNAATGKKDGWFRRVPSLSDSDTSEPSFIDMLKSSSKKASVIENQPTESFDASQAGRGGGKKKGKKGRQIDPALLGFKVTSNRIMMGEIQRVED